MNLNLSTISVLPPVDNSPRRQLLTPLPTPGEFLLVLDNSSLEKFTTCPTAAKNYLVLGREAHARNAALVFGGAVHAGLEKLLVGASPQLQDEAIVNHFAKHPTPPDEYRTPACALEVLKHYRVRSTFPDYQWELLSDAKGVLVERAFELPLGVIEVNDFISMPWLAESEIHRLALPFADEGYIQERHSELLAQNRTHLVWVTKIHVAWSGRIDAVARANGMARVVDHKTTSIAGDQVIQDFHLSNQTIGYVWACQQLWPDLQVQGFCGNFIHLKKPNKGQGLMDRGIRGGEPPLNFFRAYFEYSPERLAWWHNNVIHIVSDFIHNLVRDYFPSHTKWCFGKYGACPYHNVCSQDSDALRASMLNSDMFRPVTWNPLADR